MESARSSDAQLMRESATSPTVFAVLYQRHRRSVGAYVARRAGGEAAEDLTAEVFARAFRARAGYEPQHDSILPWLLGISTNVISEHRKLERRRLAALEQVVRSAPTAVAPEVAGLAPDLVRQLKRLPTADRDTLLLVVWGELSYDEAASALRVPVGTVRSRVARARARLSDAINDRAVREPRAGDANV